MRCMKVFSDGYVWIADIGHEVTKHFLDISRHFLASLDTSKHHMSTSAQKFSRHLWTPCIVFKVYSQPLCVTRATCIFCLPIPQFLGMRDLYRKFQFKLKHVVAIRFNVKFCVIYYILAV